MSAAPDSPPPDCALFDTHVHLWALANPFTRWPTADWPAIHRDYLPHDLERVLAASGAEGCVLVQASPSVAETRWLLTLADAHPAIAAVVGWIDCESQDAPDVLADLARHPKLRGLRPMVQDIPMAGWLNDPALAPVFQAMADRGLVLDALVRCHQIPDVTALADAHPDLVIVLDHGGKPPIAAGAMADWAAAVAALAERPNVQCKLSGLWTEAGDDLSTGRIRPFVQHLLDCFGPDRLLWGSDWPVVELAGTHAGWLAESRALLDGCTAAQRAAILSANGRRIYGAGS